MEGFTDEEIAKAVDHCDNDKIRSEFSFHLSVSTCFVGAGCFRAGMSMVRMGRSMDPR
jgi:hypothetical protein